MNKMYLPLIIVVAIISSASAIDISFGGGDGSQSYSTSQSYQLDHDASLFSSSSGSRTHAVVSGSAIASVDGVFVANDDEKSTFDFYSDGTTSEVKSGNDLIAFRSGDVAMSTEFLNADGTKTISGPVNTVSGGNLNAYSLYGYRWNTKDPQLKWVLKNDANMASEGLSSGSVQAAISGASNTWDSASNQNLFADSNLVTLNPIVATEKNNKINTISWRPFGSTCLGYARTYYRMDNIGGYHSAIDSDLVFNTDYNWRTDGSWNGVDVHTAALHEIGHTLGLGDIYGKPAFKYDTRQVMHYYTDVKRTLGNGDSAGLFKLYG